MKMDSGPLPSSMKTKNIRENHFHYTWFSN